MRPTQILACCLAAFVFNGTWNHISSGQQPSELPPLRPATTTTGPAVGVDRPTATFSSGRPLAEVQESVAPRGVNSLQVPRPNAGLGSQFSDNRLPNQSQISSIPSAPGFSESSAAGLLITNSSAPTVDKALQPAGFSSAAPPQTDTASTASALLDELDIHQSGIQLPGQPMALLDMLAHTEPRRRSSMINQYWATYQAWTAYRFAIDEMHWLQQLGQPAAASDQLMLEAALSAADNNVAQQQLELMRQQGKLNLFLQGPVSETLPLPSDRPLVGRYRTNFEMYAAQAPMPESLRQLNQWLPKQQMLISGRAETVQRCRTAVARASQAFKQGSVPIGSMLQAIELCRANHHSFIDTVVGYNRDVAQYALSVKPYVQAPSQVVAMLIPMPAAASTPQLPADMRQATLDGTPYNAAAASGFPPTNASFDRATSLQQPFATQPAAVPAAANAAQQLPRLEPGFQQRLPGNSQFQPGGNFRR